MGAERSDDWLRVVYGPGLDRSGSRAAGAATEIAVRQSPAAPDPAQSPGGEQRVRITVIPSKPGVAWSLYLRDFGPGPGEAPTTKVWWKLDPGTWQPLGGTRQCVAKGRGRMRVDVDLRGSEDPEEGTASPRLRFVAESG